LQTLILLGSQNRRNYLTINEVDRRIGTTDLLITSQLIYDRATSGASACESRTREKRSQPMAPTKRG